MILVKAFLLALVLAVPASANAQLPPSQSDTLGRVTRELERIFLTSDMAGYAALLMPGVTVPS